MNCDLGDEVIGVVVRPVKLTNKNKCFIIKIPNPSLNFPYKSIQSIVGHFNTSKGFSLLFDSELISFVSMYINNVNTHIIQLRRYCTHKSHWAISIHGSFNRQSAIPTSFIRTASLHGHYTRGKVAVRNLKEISNECVCFEWPRLLSLCWELIGLQFPDVSGLCWYWMDGRWALIWNYFKMSIKLTL